MTDLTEQWKKGELPDGWYYIEGNRVEGIYAYTAEYLNNMYRPRNGERIIAKVPSYEEWQAKLEENAQLKSKLQLKETAYDFDTARLEEENAQLKELLKEAKKREDIIRKQLKDAQKVMIEDYFSLDYLKGVLSRQEIGNYTAQESLEKIAHDWEKDLDKYCKKWCKIKY